MTEFFSRDPTRQLELCERENEIISKEFLVIMPNYTEKM